MKLSKIEIDNMAKVLSDRLLASAGLKDAKKVTAQIKKNLVGETLRRRKL